MVRYWHIHEKDDEADHSPPAKRQKQESKREEKPSHQVPKQSLSSTIRRAGDWQLNLSNTNDQIKQHSNDQEDSDDERWRSGERQKFAQGKCMLQSKIH